MIPKNGDRKNELEPKSIVPFKVKKDLSTLDGQAIFDLINKNAGSLSVGVITGDILLRAPKNFFKEFEIDTKEIVLSVQQKLAEDALSAEAIVKAQRNPTDLVLQDKARSKVISALYTYTDSPIGSMRTNKIDANKRKTVNGLVVNEILGFGPLDPLWRDTQITEIIANGPFDIQVEIAGNIHKVPACRFRDQEHLMNLINRLYGSINKSLSLNEPILKGRLFDKSRMMAIHPAVAPDGPNFNIRRHSNDFVTPEQLINVQTADIPIMSEIGNLINAGVSAAIIGGTGSGKTTLLDALTSYIPENKRCISLEDNLEMKPHPNKLFAAAMEIISPKSGSIQANGVSMRDLVKASLQMRPETIIIGEVTDDAAYDLCQALNTGHDGMSTVHANNAKEAMYKLMSLISQSDLVKEHAAYDLIASAFDIVICVKKFPLDGSRKIVSIDEVSNKVVTDDEGNKVLPLIPLWKFEINSKETHENNKIMGEWVKVNEPSAELKEKHNLDIKKQNTWEELQEIAFVHPVNNEGGK